MAQIMWQNALAPSKIDLCHHDGPEFDKVESDKPQTPAAVLIIITADSEPRLILTRRSAHLSQHAGQISFPGGRVDDQDETIIMTALREAHEEIGLAEEWVRFEGFLPDMVTGTGFLVTPVVVQSNLSEAELRGRLICNADEVDELIFTPLSLVLNPVHYDSFKRVDKGKQWRSWRVAYQDHIIWGATATILHNWANSL